MKKREPWIRPVKLEKLTDLIPLLERSDFDIDQLCIVFRRSRPTINRWLGQLRKAGYKPRLKTGRGRPRIHL